MQLTQQELEWAWAIKDAVEQDAELNNLSDMSYGQLALMDHANVEQAIDRRLAEHDRRPENRSG